MSCLPIPRFYYPSSVERFFKSVYTQALKEGTMILNFNFCLEFYFIAFASSQNNNEN